MCFSCIYEYYLFACNIGCRHLFPGWCVPLIFLMGFLDVWNILLSILVLSFLISAYSVKLRKAFHFLHVFKNSSIFPSVWIIFYFKLAFIFLDNFGGFLHKGSIFLFFYSPISDLLSCLGNSNLFPWFLKFVISAVKERCGTIYYCF